MTISIKKLYLHPEFCTKKVDTSKAGMYLIIGFNPPCRNLPENYFDWPEAKIVAKYWTNECTWMLRDLVKKFGKKGWSKLDFEKILGRESYGMLLNDLRRGEKQYEPQGKWIHGITTPPNYFAEALISALKIPIPVFKQRKCNFCYKKFTPGIGDDVPWEYDYIGDQFSYKNMSFCAVCLKKIFGWPRPVPTNKLIAIRLLKEFYKTLGFIPPSNYLDKSFLHKLNIKTIKKIMRVMYKLPDPLYYKKTFHSWFKALIISEILPHKTRKMMRGTMLLSKDGHVCFSIGEKIIDDYFWERKIKHKKEAHYPHDTDLNPKGLLRTDWLIDKKTYIEFVGLKGQKDYDEKMLIKQELAMKKKIKLVEIAPQDIPNLAEIFKKIL